MSIRWAALGWLVLAVAQASVAHAQSDACSGALALPADWVVAPIDACPGATLARVCGAATSGACPDVSIVAAEIGASLDACRADPALLAAADALYDAGTPSSLEAAARIYLRLATPLGALALFRAARSSERLGRERDAATLYARLM